MLYTEGFILSASLFTSDLDRDKFHRPIQVVKICLIQPKLKGAPAKSPKAQPDEKHHENVKL